ncbi:phosphotransferase [Halobacillus salinarum]|uniref:Phosphotransferase n=1 Tax=Halobacillus salinarum TaxID=2932257 RepID=A0ABY4EK90_9BACI|nr:phosphotransferase [Halobacillus salinarum]UOQ44887.1 phosphotransferase [Halobacillus salinarum]
MDKIIETAQLMINEIDPEFDMDKVKVLGTGFGSIVIEGNEEIIYRIARNVETAKQYEKEVEILPIITNDLDINIPIPIWYKINTPSVPSGIMAYKKIKGYSMSNELSEGNKTKLAKEIAGFMIDLHQIPIENLIMNKNLKNKYDRESLTMLRKNTIEVLEHQLSEEEHRTIKIWWDDVLSDHTLFNYQPILCHGDMWYENILVNENQSSVVGVIDFSNMMIGDPAIDLAPQLYLGHEFYERVLKEYTNVFGNEKEIRKRVHFHMKIRELSGLQYVIHNQLFDEYYDSISKIKNIFKSSG